LISAWRSARFAHSARIDPVLREVGGLDQQQQLAAREPVARSAGRAGGPDEQCRVLDEPALAHAVRRNERSWCSRVTAVASPSRP
jgi:hypothetical protein